MTERLALELIKDPGYSTHPARTAFEKHIACRDGWEAGIVNIAWDSFRASWDSGDPKKSLGWLLPREIRWHGTPFGDLTPREHEVCRLLCDGMTCREVGRELGLSQKTIDTHRSHILRKTMMPHVVMLLRIAVQYGYVVIPRVGEMEGGK